jgi:putative PIN family toxin of toxin-antitoxin system
MYCGCCGLSTSAREQLARVAVFLADIAEMVEPETSVNLLADEADNRIRECAVAGAADRIVTGDKEMLALGGFGGVRISNLRSYLGSG